MILNKTGWYDSHLHPDGDLGAEAVERASNQADNDGAPGLDGGGSRGDGHQTSQGTVAHHAHVIDVLACTGTRL